MTFALSSMWAQHRFADVRSLAQAAGALGFPAVELSHFVTPEQVAGVAPGDVPVLAVHYPAPTIPSPYGLPAGHLLASLNEDARAWAVMQGIRCLRFAAAMNAQAVCVHLGRVEMPAHPEWALEQRYAGGQRDTPFFARLRDEIVAERARRHSPHFDAARRSLGALAERAGSLGLRIGVESRRHYREIPTLEELEVLLRDHDAQTVGFWYDGGHVQVLANLGFHRHEDWLGRFAPRIVGTHLHDVIGLRDHLLPGQGELDFVHIAHALPDAAVRTLEVDWYFTEEEVRNGLTYLRDAGCFHRKREED